MSGNRVASEWRPSVARSGGPPGCGPNARGGSASGRCGSAAPPRSQASGSATAWRRHQRAPDGRAALRRIVRRTPGRDRPEGRRNGGVLCDWPRVRSAPHQALTACVRAGMPAEAQRAERDLLSTPPPRKVRRADAPRMSGRCAREEGGCQRHGREPGALTTASSSHTKDCARMPSVPGWAWPDPP